MRITKSQLLQIINEETQGEMEFAELLGGAVKSTPTGLVCRVQGYYTLEKNLKIWVAGNS